MTVFSLATHVMWQACLTVTHFMDGHVTCDMVVQTMIMILLITQLYLQITCCICHGLYLMNYSQHARESTQWATQQNGVLHILGCDTTLDIVRNSRYSWAPRGSFTVDGRRGMLSLPMYLSGSAVSCAGSVVLTQTHPVAPYLCRTGNITLRCQYDGVENVEEYCGLLVVRQLSPITPPPIRR